LKESRFHIDLVFFKKSLSLFNCLLKSIALSSRLLRKNHQRIC